MWPFTRKGATARRVHRVWRDADARDAGLASDVRAASMHAPVVVAVRDADAAARATAALSAMAVRQAEVASTLEAELSGTRGGTIVLTRIDALSRARPAAQVSPQVHVLGLAARHADDARLLDALAAWTDRATFHVALDDALLRGAMPQLGPLIEKLGLARDAAIESPMVDHAIERAQKRAR
jgi:hypothetical protein